MRTGSKEKQTKKRGRKESSIHPQQINTPEEESIMDIPLRKTEKKNAF